MSAAVSKFLKLIGPTDFAATCDSREAALVAAGLAPHDEAAAVIAQHAADAGDSLVRLALGAREAGITVRRLSEATGISERNVRQRFRRPAAEQARP